MLSSGTVLFVGLGNMGFPMSRHLVADGRPVLVADADPARERHFVTEVGGRSLREHPDLDDVTAVVLMLPNGKVVQEALLDPTTGLAHRVPSTAVVVDMSSSDPADTAALATELGRRAIRLVDAPVSGGVARAERGTLSIMLGADDATAANVATDVVGPMSDRVFRTGGLGTGHAMKALNNFVAGASFAAASEALIVGARWGLAPEVAVEVLNASTGRSFSTENVVPQAISGEFATGFALGLLAKDVRIAGQLAERAEVDASLCRIVTERLDSAAEELGDSVDHSRAYQHWLDDSRAHDQQ